VFLYIRYSKINRLTIALWGTEIHGSSFICLRSQMLGGHDTDQYNFTECIWLFYLKAT